MYCTRKTVLHVWVGFYCGDPDRTFIWLCAKVGHSGRPHEVLHYGNWTTWGWNLGPHKSIGGHSSAYVPAEVFNRTAAEACWGNLLLLYSGRISHCVSCACLFFSFCLSFSCCPPLPHFPPVLSGTGPPSSEWNKDGLRSKPFPPAWPLHTATLCWQQNHLLQGIGYVLRYFRSLMIKYEMKCHQHWD